jgi:hypothetical protein
MGILSVVFVALYGCGVIESPLWWPGVLAGSCGLAKKGQPAIGHFGIRRHEAMELLQSIALATLARRGF